MAKPLEHLPALLAVELWGIGDVALAIPFLKQASQHARVSLLAKPHAAPLLKHFAPDVRLLPFTFPWTAFSGKYRLHRWPWSSLITLIRKLNREHFDIAVSARPDPRDHVILALAGAKKRLGFPLLGSSAFLTTPLAPPHQPHRAEHWNVLSLSLGWPNSGQPSQLPPTANPRRIALHVGAAQPTRRLPIARWREIAHRLEIRGWKVAWMDDSITDLDDLIARLSQCSRFIGNDSGPGHLAALLGIPTFTVFGPQLPDYFLPRHPSARWAEGSPCPYKPCFDHCRFNEPRCLLVHTPNSLWPYIEYWINTPPAATLQ